SYQRPYESWGDDSEDPPALRRAYPSLQPWYAHAPSSKLPILESVGLVAQHAVVAPTPAGQCRFAQTADNVACMRLAPDYRSGVGATIWCNLAVVWRMAKHYKTDSQPVFGKARISQPNT